MLKKPLIWCIMLSLLLSGCGGAGITFSARPTVALQASVLGMPTPPFRVGARYPRIACYGYQSGYVMIGASSRHVYRNAMG